MNRFEPAATLLERAVAAHAFPAACAEVGRGSGPLWRQAFGAMTYDPYDSHIPDDTIFDLASLTKPVATATLAMRAIDDGLLALDEPLSGRLREWRGRDREAVTIRDLLSHCSGLPAYLPFFRDHTGRVEFEPAICRTALEYGPRTQSVYSDLGFILLGFILEDARTTAGAPGRLEPSAALSAQFRKVASFVTAEPLMFNPPRTYRTRTAPTEFDAWRGRTLSGEVHDENAWALGGAAGHAGLFGTAAAVGAFARATLATVAGDRILAQPATMREFITPPTGHPRKLASARMGHDAAHVLVRSATVRHCRRPHRFQRHVAVDRLGTRPLYRAPDQPRPPEPRQQSDPRDPSRLPRRSCQMP